ncbi:neutral zinc metallopeptidase [Nocardiopsis baichengensis]|uniref:neutral zinc metallopeptidase n=1 Tax=Nocardiopsis baichengensis TaxID=280240 RepID=UPI00036E8EB7|nr:neutral zinc metallopeptidase [Nocardiopsis baichengensis]
MDVGQGRRRTALFAALAAASVALFVLLWTAAGGSSAPAPGGGSSAPDEAAAPGADSRVPAGREALVDNPLYDTGRLAPLPCPVPDPDVEDPASMERFLDTVADCLDQAWSTQFAQAGLPYDPPSRVFWTEPGSSPCRDYPSEAGAFYCRTNQSVYIGTEDVVRKWQGETNGAVYASLLAHEYAHHVQGESGLLEYYHERRGRESGRRAQNAWTRRSELQANCLAGAFLGSVAVSYPLEERDTAAVLEDAEATADRPDGPEEDRTHGSQANSRAWTERGLEGQSPGSCNTWTAEPALVQ